MVWYLFDPLGNALYALLMLLITVVVIIIAVVIIIKVLGHERNQATGTLLDITTIPGVRLEYWEIPLPDDTEPRELLARLEEALRSYGVIAVAKDDLLYIEGYTPWMIKIVEGKDKRYLRIASFAKEWVVVVLLVLILAVTPIGVLAAVYVLWQYMKVKDALRMALSDVLGPEAYRYI